MIAAGIAGALAGLFLVYDRIKRRRAIPALTVSLDCRGCGFEMPYPGPGGAWAGLLPIEEFTGFRVCKGESGIFLCAYCFETVARESLIAFQCNPWQELRERLSQNPPPAPPLNPPNDWFGYWL